MMLLIHPPVVKPSEPPAGIGKLCGALRREGVKVTALDANLEGLIDLLEKGAGASREGQDRWTGRACRGFPSHLKALRGPAVYRHPSRYRRAVADLGRLLEQEALPAGVRLGLGNFGHEKLSPVKSEDLIRAAERPEENPFYPWFVRRLEELLVSEGPSWAGFSLNYLSQALTTFAMIGHLRAACPGVRIVLGGGLVTSWLSRPGWRDPFRGLVDRIIAGPGEGPLLSLLRVSKGGDKKEERVFIADALPDYEDFPLNAYLSPGAILPYGASRGCYWRRCLFCPERAEGNAYLPLAPGRAVADLRSLAEKTNPVLIHLLDNALDPRLLEALAKDPPGVPWYGFARVTARLAEADFCRALKRSGCAMLKLGLESGDQRVLDRLEKGIDLWDASRALGALREAGIPAYVYLLFGTPAENSESARRTLDFVVRHGEDITFLNVALFNLPLAAAGSLGLDTRSFYEGDLSLYADFSHPEGWQRPRVRAFLDREFRRHPVVSPILRRDPPVFTSNHAPFFTEGFPDLR